MSSSSSSSATATANTSSNFTTGQSWGGLKKAWKGYRIAKVQGDPARMREFAEKIRKIQGELGIAVSAFPHLGLP